jgi:hypothetical protein
MRLSAHILLSVPTRDITEIYLRSFGNESAVSEERQK